MEIQPRAVLMLLPSMQVASPAPLFLFGSLVPVFQGAPSVKAFQSEGLTFFEAVVQVVPPEKLTLSFPIARLMPVAMGQVKYRPEPS